MQTLKDRHVVVTGGTGRSVRPSCGNSSRRARSATFRRSRATPPTRHLPDSQQISIVAQHRSVERGLGRRLLRQAAATACRGEHCRRLCLCADRRQPGKVLQQQLSMNLVSCVLSCRAAVANFRKGGQAAHIVNISARPALDPRQGANMTAYTASKAAVAAFTVALAEELKNENISAIALAPSTIDTPVNRKDMPTPSTTPGSSPRQSPS